MDLSGVAVFVVAGLVVAAVLLALLWMTESGAQA